MRAAVLRNVKDLRIEEVDTPEPGHNSVRVKVEACGICQTDFSAYSGARMNWEPPCIIGHGISGIANLPPMEPSISRSKTLF